MRPALRLALSGTLSLLALAQLAPAAVPAAPVAPDERGGTSGTRVDAAAVTPNWLARLNAMRAQYGARPLVLDPDLTRHAASWSRHLAATDQLEHGDLVGAQNVAANSGAHSGRDFVEQWAAAPYHQLNQLDPGLTHVGLATSRSADGTWYATLNLRGAAGVSPRPRSWPRGTERLVSYPGGESPDPTVGCPARIGKAWGLPVLATLAGPEARATGWQVTMAENGHKLPICAKAVGGSVLVMARRPLVKGSRYTGSASAVVDGRRRSVAIGFSVAR